MEKREIIAALSHSAGLAIRPVDDCLGAFELAAYFDGALEELERVGVESHLADCDHCLAQLAVLSRSHGDEVPAKVPEAQVARAVALASVPEPNRRWSNLARRFAAAAVVVLAVGILFTQINLNPRPVATPQVRETPKTRYADSQAMAPVLLTPSAGSRIVPAEQMFTWSVVPGTLFYDVRLVSEEGDLLWQERVSDTHWQVPKGLSLKAGNEYFVRVDAYLSDAKYLSSEHLVFRVSGEP